MKFKVLSFILLSIFLSTTSLMADSHTEKDLVDTAVSAVSFDTLVVAVKAAELVDTLKGFIRFQKIGPDSYLALIAPRYDVLPFIRRHFESRFADQK